MEQTSSLQYEYFHIVATDIKDSTYYVGKSEDSTSEPVDYCWCKSNELLKVGNKIYGYLSNPASLDSKNLPILVINN